MTADPRTARPLPAAPVPTPKPPQRDLKAEQQAAEGALARLIPFRVIPGAALIPATVLRLDPRSPHDRALERARDALLRRDAPGDRVPAELDACRAQLAHLRAGAEQIQADIGRLNLSQKRDEQWLTQAEVAAGGRRPWRDLSGERSLLLQGGERLFKVIGQALKSGSPCTELSKDTLEHLIVSQGGRGARQTLAADQPPVPISTQGDWLAGDALAGYGERLQGRLHQQTVQGYALFALELDAGKDTGTWQESETHRWRTPFLLEATWRSVLLERQVVDPYRFPARMVPEMTVRYDQQTYPSLYSSR